VLGFLRQAEPQTLSQRLTALLAYLDERRRTRLPIKSSGRVQFVETARIDWVEADGKMVRVHAGNEVYLTRETLGGIAERLDPERFVRVHRSALVNLDSIREAQPWFQGDYVLILKDGTKVTTGRAYREVVRRILGER